MPKMNGLEATRRIRQASNRNRHLYICALTASAMNGDMERCITAGCDEYLSKPIKMDSLIVVLEKCKNSKI